MTDPGVVRSHVQVGLRQNRIRRLVLLPHLRDGRHLVRARAREEVLVQYLLRLAEVNVLVVVLVLHV